MKVVASAPGDGRVALFPLLLLADRAEAHVRVHLDDGTVFALVDDDTVIGAVQCVPHRDLVWFDQSLV